MFAGACKFFATLGAPRYVANEGRFKSLWYLYPPDTAIDEATATRLVMNWFKPLGYCAVAKCERCNDATLDIVESN